jgi:hypothetical protein|tara:strand:- start:226 stop:1467 length:1242 start_codon:yes stop_codon:yes gene_type:complete
MNINSIINEWTYRLPKGYPDSKQDYQELRSVLKEMTDLSEAEREALVRKAMGLSEQDDSENNIQSIEDTLNNIGLTSDIITQVMNIYSQLSNTEQEEFNKNFRIHSIDSFVNNGWKAFAKFFLVNVGGARGGMGNGEISILLGVKDSMPGGTARHDIVMPNGEWEVKELKSSKFDPAKEGLASKFELTTKIKDFYKNIVNPIKEIGDPFQSLKHLVNPESAEDLKKLIMIFETRFESVIDPEKFATFEWKKSAMHNWYEGFKELNEIFYKTKLDTSVKDTRLTVNTGDSQKSYWISDEDVEEIELSSGEDVAADVYVGDQVDNINSNVVIWFKRIERNEFVRNPQQFLFDLNSIKNSFFNNILGLLWYNYRNPQPYIGRAEDFAVDLVSQGRYRFVLKSASSSQGYKYLQGQG